MIYPILHVFNDFEGPLTHISRTRRYSTFSISETVQEGDMDTLEC